jgi:transposase
LARKLITLGHEARMMPPAYVKPYIRRQKNDASDASAICEAVPATIQDTSSFAGPREFAAFLGLTPRQNSSGGKPKLGRVSKMGNRYLRKLLVVGAHAVLRKRHADPLRMWAKKLVDRKPFKLVAVALANKMARIAFAIMRGATVYREIPA